jgi:hypothetical protein
MAASDSEAKGGGISIAGTGTLTVTASELTGNTAAATDPTSVGGATAYGGGIYAEVPVTVANTSMSGNKALAASGVASAFGGAVVADADLSLTHVTVSGNVARATSDDAFVSASGGGVDAAGGITHVTASTFTENTVKAVSHAGADAQFGGDAQAAGGGLVAQTLSMGGSRVSGNSVAARSDAFLALANGGGLALHPNGSGSTLSTLTNSVVSGNRVTVNAHEEATALGGGMGGGLPTLERSSVTGNQASAHSVANAAFAYGGGVNASDGADLRRSTVGRNQAVATAPAGSADVQGAGVKSHVTVSLATSTVAANRGVATSGGAGATGQTIGGGIEATNVTLLASTVASNSLRATGDTAVSRGGGVHAFDTLTMRGSILAANVASNGADCYGPASSQGYNLVQRVAGCLDAPRPTDLTGTAAKLGVLADNGGPTQTMAVPTTSPAFDAIPARRCPGTVDQRGFHRPQGPACDIGAFEHRPAD